MQEEPGRVVVPVLRLARVRAQVLVPLQASVRAAQDSRTDFDNVRAHNPLRSCTKHEERAEQNRDLSAKQALSVVLGFI